jgi:hypothetical protein
MSTTVTPKVTWTKTVCVTVTDRRKGVCSVTETKTVKKQTTTTKISTSTVCTSKDVTSTYTAPAPANFTPIQSSLPGSANGTISAKRSVNNLKKRNSPPVYEHKAHAYPEMVMCKKYTQHNQCKAEQVKTTMTLTAKPRTITVEVNIMPAPWEHRQSTDSI